MHKLMFVAGLSLSAGIAIADVTVKTPGSDVTVREAQQPNQAQPAAQPSAQPVAQPAMQAPTPQVSQQVAAQQTAAPIQWTMLEGSVASVRAHFAAGPERRAASAR